MKNQSFDVPSTVGGGEDMSTPTSSNRKKEMKQNETASNKPSLLIKTSIPVVDSEMLEVDVYENPTELFQWINYGNFPGATQRVLEYPIEARTWIVSRAKKSGKDREYTSEVKWRYLPLHLICLKQNPSESLLRALLFAFPRAARERDHDGNLPIHYLLAEGSNHNNLLQLILESYPESIHKRDRKGRSPLEIVSESFRAGRVTKDCMVQMLSVLRQWTLDDDQNVARSQNIIRRTPLRGTGDEARDQPDQPFVSFSFDLPDIPSSSRAMVVSPEKHDYGYLVHGRGRSKSRGRLGSDTDEDITPRSKPKARATSASRSRGGKSAETKLEDIRTERDVLRETLSKLKTQTSQQEIALVALNRQVVDTSADLGKGREKVRRKKIQVDDLQTQVKERDEMIIEYKEALEKMKKERKMMNERLAKKDAAHKEELERLIEFNTEAGECDREEQNRLKARVQSLEGELRAAKDNPATPAEVMAIMADAKTSQSRLNARIASLERELLQALGAVEADTMPARTPEMSKLEDERNALKMMNDALEEHVTALKERLSHLQEDETQKEALRGHVQSLEKDLVSVRLKYSSAVDALESTRSESLIKESKLQTKIAQVERELLDIVSTRDAQIRAATSAAVLGSKQDEEEKKSIQMMNETLQDHISALKEKCLSMETSYAEVKKHNVDLAEELAALRIRGHSNNAEQGIGDRQRELKSEFNDLLTSMQRMKQDGIQNDESQATITRLQGTVQDLQTKLRTFQSQNEMLRIDLAQLQSSRKNALASSSETSGGVAAVQLAKLAESYKQHWEELKEKFDTLTTDNASLRDIVATNNGTYLHKVEALSRKISELKNANSSLHEHVHSLSTENTKLRESYRMLGENEGAQHRLRGLSNRLNQVAAYLIAVSSLQREQTEAFVTDSRQSEGSFDGGRGHWQEARQDVILHEEAMLRGAGEDRNAILQAAMEHHEELGIMDFMQNQEDFDTSFDTLRDELREISIQLGNDR
jgi:chromosome segregation ATPase